MGVGVDVDVGIGVGVDVRRRRWCMLPLLPLLAVVEVVEGLLLLVFLLLLLESRAWTIGRSGKLFIVVIYDLFIFLGGAYVSNSHHNSDNNKGKK